MQRRCGEGLELGFLIFALQRACGSWLDAVGGWFSWYTCISDGIATEEAPTSRNRNGGGLGTWRAWEEDAQAMTRLLGRWKHLCGLSALGPANISSPDRKFALLLVKVPRFRKEL